LRGLSDEDPPLAAATLFFATSRISFSSLTNKSANQQSYPPIISYLLAKVIDSVLLVLFERALVLCHLHLRIWVRSIRVLNEAASQGVVENERERS
jgi:hypothetical protein